MPRKRDGSGLKVTRVEEFNSFSNCASAVAESPKYIKSST